MWDVKLTCESGDQQCEALKDAAIMHQSVEARVVLFLCVWLGQIVIIGQTTFHDLTHGYKCQHTLSAA